MNSINLSIPRKISSYKMDPTSDRYRICLNDGVEFMANHRSMKHCCDQCADEYSNQKKKNDKINLQAEIDEALAAPIPEPPKIVEAAKEVETIGNAETLPLPLVSNISIIGTVLGNRHSAKVYKKFSSTDTLKLGGSVGNKPSLGNPFLFFW